jgi:hypothetical protein
MTIIRPGKPVDLDNPGQTEIEGVEGEIREFVRRDVTAFRRSSGSSLADPGSDVMANNVNSLVQRVAATSTQEIDKLIAELTTLREYLRSESERVQREIGGYAQLSQSALASTKVIADAMSQWKAAYDARNSRG